MTKPHQSLFHCFMAAAVLTLVPTQLLIQRSKALKLSSLGSRIEDLSTNLQNAIESQTSTATSTGNYSPSHYGVDYSFPIHRIEDFSIDKEDDPFDSTSKRMFYREFMHGCRTKYAPEGFLCDDTEVERLEMNLRQPSSMRVSWMGICGVLFSLMSYVNWDFIGLLLFNRVDFRKTSMLTLAVFMKMGWTGPSIRITHPLGFKKFVLRRN